jgi:hypothetical protein
VSPKQDLKMLWRFKFTGAFHNLKVIYLLMFMIEFCLGNFLLMCNICHYMYIFLV